jgi:hypothetical protein
MPFGPAHRHPGLPQVRRKTMSEPRIMTLVAGMVCILYLYKVSDN